MVEFIKGMLYTCDCGYKTTNTNLASKHSKTIKCQAHTMNKKDVEFVLKEDYLAASGINIAGDHNTTTTTNIGTQNVTINLTVPDKTIVAAIYEAVKNQECLDEIRYSDPEQIPAILFKYTRGSKAEQQVIKYDPDKDVVRHKDPVTGHEVSKDLKKYRNEYLVKNADVYDDTYHIQYMPNEIQRNMKELSKPMFESGKKKDNPIPAATVIKMCASGDHRMYKLPHESKQFYTDVSKNVDDEIKQII